MKTYINVTFYTIHAVRVKARVIKLRLNYLVVVDLSDVSIYKLNIKIDSTKKYSREYKC